MSMEDIQRFIELATSAESTDFAGPVPEAEISDAENVIGLAFPPTYRQFVKRLGAGNVEAQEFNGIIHGKSVAEVQESPSVGLTLRERVDVGLPESMIIVSDTGTGEYYVLDASRTAVNGDLPVDIWSPGLGITVEENYATDFGAFALSFVDEGRA